MIFLKLIFILFTISQLSYAFHNGADDSVCQDMTPSHGPFVPATSPAPFTVTTSVSSISPGQQLTVSITRTNTATALLGFMIQARSTAGTVHGQFLPAQGMRLMGCAPIGGSATHSVSEQRASITLTWVPPPIGFVGNVVFHVTAVQDFALFWTHVQSGPVAVNP
ncbi:putative defense protein Hdd11 [Bradysia coprophila]|uniref:putative defense protein Hdd11 n=1 Tax=Bradysia coprophila TaxID=38358 RepID=UPI00187DD5E0|nr:putative defense protein Hdd11 [Bradysia coprophila]